VAFCCILGGQAVATLMEFVDCGHMWQQASRSTLARALIMFARLLVVLPHASWH
jgi:hypothetical protein